VRATFEKRLPSSFDHSLDGSAIIRCQGLVSRGHRDHWIGAVAKEMHLIARSLIEMAMTDFLGYAPDTMDVC
jgi:hypothetical protein